MDRPMAGAQTGLKPNDICIEIKDVHKRYGKLDVLTGVDLSLRRGQVTVVCGRSGSGKSTLLRCINGLESFHQGQILVDAVSVSDPRTDLSALRAKLGMVFQHFYLYPHMSVLANITLAPRIVGHEKRAQAEERARALLKRVGLPTKAASYPGELSGGEQQRVAIARAMAMEPAAILFDEPTSALDPQMTKDVLDVIAALAKSGMTMVIVTHEMGFARKVADEIVFMEHGKVLHHSKPEDFFENATHPSIKLFLRDV
jgi:ABC-type polar amino acid transport system ATPase subunit